MSATGRTIEAACIAIDVDNPKARKALEAEALRISNEAGIDIDAVRRILTSVRARKRKSTRSKGDFYETPAWAIDAICAHLPISGEPLILDAGAGNGAIAARVATLNPKAEIVGVEKNPELVTKARARNLYAAEFVEANFLRWQPEGAAPDVVIFNPPFSYALEFVEHARSIAKRGGTVAALLRLNWLAGKARREFHKKHPADVYVLTKRPGFTGNGKTDATEYAWFVWGPGAGGRWFLLTHDDKSRRRPRVAKQA